MTRYHVELDCTVLDISEGAFAALFEPVADALYDLDGLIDADLAASTGERLFTFSMSVDAPDQVAALTAAVSATRTAVHVAGGSTPEWEKHLAMVRTLITDEIATQEFVTA